MANTGKGTNYRNGSVNSGSDMVGWDSGYVRAEVFSFTTGNWPVTKIQFRTPTTTLYQGSNIAIRCGISTSATTYVKSYGTGTGHAVTKNGSSSSSNKTTISCSLKKNTRYYITFFPGIAKSAGWGLLNIDKASFSVTLTEITYTKCNPPTTLTLSRTIQNPEQNVTLSWDGATAGNNLTIGSYDIYRATSADGDYGTKPIISDVTDTSCSVTAPTAGNYYYYKVVTKPAESVTGWDSDPSDASDGLKGNTAPGAPTVEIKGSGSVVPSSGGNIKFEVTPGTDNDGQTLTLAYSTTPTGDKTSFPSPLTLRFTEAATLYFYTYDGLTYSAATTQVITKNTKPTISINENATVIGTYSALGGTGTTGSQLGYASNITPAILTSTTGKVTVELEYYSSDNTNPWPSSSVSQTTIQEITTSSTSVVLSNYNIHKNIGLGKDKILGANNVHWRLRLKINDGIEDSDYVYYPASSRYYAIARASSVLETYNKIPEEGEEDSDVDFTIHEQVWREVHLKVYNDTSTTVISASATVGDSSVNITTATRISGVYRYIDITLPDGIAGGATINITAQTTDSSDSIIKSINTTVTETKIPTVGDLFYDADKIKPFTDSGDFNVKIGWPFVPYTTLDSATLAAYNCDRTVTNVIKIIHSSSNSGDGENRITKTPLTWVRDGDYIISSLNKASIYDWNHSLGITSYSGSHTYWCRLEITNLFGKTVCTKWVKKEFNFVEPAQNPTINSIEYSIDNRVTWKPLGDKAIQEGVYLRFNCSFGLYTTDKVEVSVLLTNSSGERSISCYEFGTSPEVYTPITYPVGDLTYASDNSAAEINTKSYVYQITTEIADTTNRQWRIKIENSGGTAYSNPLITPVVKQCAPVIEFSSCTVSTVNLDYYFAYAFTINNTGGGGSLVNYLCDDSTSPDLPDGKVELTLALNEDHGEVKDIEVLPNWETKTISVKSVSTVTGLYPHTKIYYSDAIIVYQISPTIAYRKNQLGINTDNPESDAIVDIHQSTGKEFIIIQGVDVNNKINMFKIDPITGEIKFYFDGTLQSTVNPKKGYLT